MKGKAFVPQLLRSRVYCFALGLLCRYLCTPTILNPVPFTTCPYPLHIMPCWAYRTQVSLLYSTYLITNKNKCKYLRNLQGVPSNVVDFYVFFVNSQNQESLIDCTFLFMKYEMHLRQIRYSHFESEKLGFSGNRYNPHGTDSSTDLYLLYPWNLFSYFK